MIPRVCFAHLPTPIEFMPRLSAQLGGSRLLIKRDDQTGLALGGNKTRKLETLLAEAQANGARTLITAGAIQSNHCRQTAAAAARFGFDCVLVLVGSPPAIAQGNLLLDGLFGAEIVWTSRPEREATLKQVFNRAWENGRRPFLIPYGGSSPVGAAGYALAFDEFLQQDREQGLNVNWIVFASSSGGTQAGLVAGARRAGWSGHILGISVDETVETLTRRVASLASETSERLGGRVEFAPEEIEVNADYLGGGYAVMGAPEREAIQLFAKTEGVLLDPVYTGRAAAGLIDLVRKGFFKPEDRVLFWHTGGAPALFAEPFAQQLQG